MDRFLAINNWLINFNSFNNQHLAQVNSDHTPMLLMTHNSSQSTKNKIFHFYNFWLEYEGCHNFVLRAWNVNSRCTSMHSFYHSIVHTKQNLLRWRHMGISHIQEELTSTKREIINIYRRGVHFLWRCLEKYLA